MKLTSLGYFDQAGFPVAVLRSRLINYVHQKAHISRQMWWRRAIPAASAAAACVWPNFGFVQCAPKAQPPNADAVPWTLNTFGVPVKSYSTREEGYKDLGVNLCVRSYAARVVKTLPVLLRAPEEPFKTLGLSAV